MGRPPGSRNPDYDATRATLVRALHSRLAARDGARASFRELATAAGVSIATLRHYFGDREGAIDAVLASAHVAGLPYLQEVATGATGPVRASLEWLLRYCVDGLVHGGVASLHELGMSAGFQEPTIGPSYLAHILEPTLQAVEARLARHVAAGELSSIDLRVAAIELIAPVLVAVLHQSGLGGAQLRPLDLDAFIAAHLTMFLRAYEVVPNERSTKPRATAPSRNQPTRRPRRA